MNYKQKIILSVMIAAIFLMLLFPPFHVIIKGTTLNKGYGLLFSPPKHADNLYASVNIGMLIVQWLAVLILGGLSLFIFDRDKIPSPKKDKKAENYSNIDESKKFFGGIYHPWRRFFARTLDISILGLGILFILSEFLRVISPDIVEYLQGYIGSPFILSVIIYIIWLPFEAAFISILGTTPFKWLFGIHVLTKSGAKLKFSKAFTRTYIVWAYGEGLGIPFLLIFTRLFFYYRLTKKGTTFWDNSVDSVVTHKSWGPLRIVTCTLAVIAILFAYSLLNTINNHKNNNSESFSQNIKAFSVAQESFYRHNSTYTDDINELSDYGYNAIDGVNIYVLHADEKCYYSRVYYNSRFKFHVYGPDLIIAEDDETHEKISDKLKNLDWIDRKKIAERAVEAVIRHNN
ncbi:MAG: RDD family protein [Desulfatiglans sp.]|nr:RDD family protein [Desulfatiglans sp.]